MERKLVHLFIQFVGGLHLLSSRLTPGDTISGPEPGPAPVFYPSMLAPRDGGRWLAPAVLSTVGSGAIRAHLQSCATWDQYGTQVHALAHTCFTACAIPWPLGLYLDTMGLEDRLEEEGEGQDVPREIPTWRILMTSDIMGARHLVV